MYAATPGVEQPIVFSPGRLKEIGDVSRDEALPMGFNQFGRARRQRLPVANARANSLRTRRAGIRCGRLDAAGQATRSQRVRHRHASGQSFPQQDFAEHAYWQATWGRIIDGFPARNTAANVPTPP